MNSQDRSLRSLARRARLAVSRGIVRLIADGGGLQLVQAGLMANETRSNLERLQEYGFTSVPLPGAEAAVIFVGGNRDHGLVIAVDDRRYRLKPLEGGEVALYTDEGDYIKLGRNREIEVNTQVLRVIASDMVRMETPELRVTGEIIDRCDTNGDTMQEMRQTYNIHTHAEDSTGNTEIPNQLMGV